MNPSDQIVNKITELNHFSIMKKKLNWLVNSIHYPESPKVSEGAPFPDKFIFAYDPKNCSLLGDWPSGPGSDSSGKLGNS